jgi:hypothetical protein
MGLEGQTGRLGLGLGRKGPGAFHGRVMTPGRRSPAGPVAGRASGGGGFVAALGRQWGLSAGLPPGLMAGARRGLGRGRGLPRPPPVRRGAAAGATISHWH